MAGMAEKSKEFLDKGGELYVERRSEAMRATVVGAGVVGLATALTLAERGRAGHALRAVARTRRQRVVARGRHARALLRGRERAAERGRAGQGAIDWWDAHVPGVARKGTLVVAPPRDAGEIDRFAARTRRMRRVDEARIARAGAGPRGAFSQGPVLRAAKAISIRASRWRR